MISIKRPPLCVDLDGTLISGDTLQISVRALLHRSCWVMLPLACALLMGRLAFKNVIASRIQLDPRILPWRQSVLKFLYDQHESGRRLILATAAPQRFGEAVASHLGIFEAVIASDARHNLKGECKLRAIRNFTAGGDFDYAGDSWVDVPIFAAARNCIIVTKDKRLLARAYEVGRIERVFSE